jgi:hypothetical protein
MGRPEISAAMYFCLGEKADEILFSAADPSVDQIDRLAELLP